MALEMSVRSRGFIDDFSDDSASESSDEERDDGMYHPHHKEEFTGDEQEGVKGAGRTKLISFEVVLVLISTFLIMTNFYIIAPVNISPVLDFLVLDSLPINPIHSRRRSFRGVWARVLP